MCAGQKLCLAKLNVCIVHVLYCTWPSNCKIQNRSFVSGNKQILHFATTIEYAFEDTKTAKKTDPPHLCRVLQYTDGLHKKFDSFLRAPFSCKFLKIGSVIAYKFVNTNTVKYKTFV